MNMIMRSMTTQFFVLILAGSMLGGRVHAQGSKLLGQGVGLWPPGYNPSGVHFVIYQLHEAETHILDETSPGSMISYSPDPANAITWRCDIGNFNGGVDPWLPGDTLIILGSFDSAYVSDPVGYGSRQDHTGFCWIYSDTVTPADPETWMPPDSVRVMPKPLVSITGTGAGANDTIWVRIPNPQETRRPDQTDYDVLGYWLWADTTGTGTPDAFDDTKAVAIGFIPVQGVYGDTTVYWQLESDLFLPWAHWTTYFAYKIVARPDTIGGKSCGYATYFFSQNSDPVDVYQIMVGMDDSEQIHIDHAACHAFPNPFSKQTVLSFTIVEPSHVKIVLFNILGQLVATVCDDVRDPGVHHVRINGDALAAGVYYYRFETSGAVQTGRLVLLH